MEVLMKKIEERNHPVNTGFVQTYANKTYP